MITIGSVFHTPYETGCVATTTPDRHGQFLAEDSEGVECQYGIGMVTVLNGRTELYTLTVSDKKIMESASLYDAHTWLETYFTEHPRAARCDITQNGEPYGYVTRKAPKSIKFAVPSA